MKMWLYNPILNTERCKYWASLAYWNYSEAITLSMEIDPSIEDNSISEEQAQKNGDEFMLRRDIIGRATAIKFDSVPYYIIPDLEDEEQQECVFRPTDFVKWAEKNLPSFPEFLYLAVRSHVENGVLKKTNNDEPRGGNSGSDARWSQKREITAKAMNFVEKSLKDGCEYCDHCQLADFMYHNASDDQGNTLFEYPALHAL